MSSYNFSESELNYLMEGEVGGYRERELEKRIADKAAKTPARLQGLCADIDILHERGYLDEDKIQFQPTFIGYSNMPDEVLHPFSKHRPRHKNDPDVYEWTPHGMSALGSSRVEAAEIGITIGRMVNQVTEDLDSDRAHIEYAAELVWGFVEGLCYYDRILYEDVDEVDIEHRSELVDKVTRKLLSVEPAYHTGRVKESKQRWEEIRQRVRASVSDESDPEWFEDQITGYVAAKFMNADLGDLTDEYIEEVIGKNNLRERHRSEVELHEAVKRLRSHRYRGANASEVVKSLDAADERMRAKDIAEEIGSYVGAVSVVAESLAGIDKDRHGVRDDHIWSDQSIVEGNKENGWKLTEYGKRIFHHL